MRMGVVVRLPDGRIGTVVYNGLDGVGIKWGSYSITTEDIKGHGGLFSEPPLKDYKWFPDAMLRDDYLYADLPCVGGDFEIIATPPQEPHGGREGE